MFRNFRTSDAFEKNLAMPWPYYMPNCKCKQRSRFLPTCLVCGKANTYAGFAPSLVEMWCQYVRLSGLRPFGAHKATAKILLDQCTRKCKQCNGTGYLDVHSAWQRCDQCLSTGRVLTCDRAVFRTAIEKIMRQFPDAKASEQSIFLRGENPSC